LHEGEHRRQQRQLPQLHAQIEAEQRLEQSLARDVECEQCSGKGSTVRQSECCRKHRSEAPRRRAAEPTRTQRKDGNANDDSPG